MSGGECASLDGRPDEGTSDWPFAYSGKTIWRFNASRKWPMPTAQADQLSLKPKIGQIQ